MVEDHLKFELERAQNFWALGFIGLWVSGSDRAWAQASQNLAYVEPVGLLLRLSKFKIFAVEPNITLKPLLALEQIEPRPHQTHVMWAQQLNRENGLRSRPVPALLETCFFFYCFGRIFEANSNFSGLERCNLERIRTKRVQSQTEPV